MSGRRLVGLMSGTSLDGVDAVLAEEDEGGRWRTLAALTRPYPDTLKAQLSEVCTAEQWPAAPLLALDRALAECYAQATQALLADHPHPRPLAIGCHGQTIRHLPRLGNSWQIGDGARLAALTGLPVVNDFRRADLAAGGDGAPLAPLFHRALLWRGEPVLVVINIGGIANLSLIGPTRNEGFDSGPGNVLMDAWSQRHLGRPWDEGGAFAARGRVHPELLRRLLAHPYFRRPPPKSTGREDFHLAWLERELAGLALPPEDVQATLCELTACSIAAAVTAHAPPNAPVLVAGGGVKNRTLMARLAHHLAPRPVTDTGARGVDPDYLEALGFAWLAARRLDGAAVDTGPITGARRPVILGALHLPPPQARSERGT